MKAMTMALVVLMTFGTMALAAEWSEGEVKRVDPGTGKVTLKHGEMKEHNMPGMTMVFTLKDPAWAKQLKPGQQVRFQSKDLGGGKMQIEAIEPVSAK